MELTDNERRAVNDAALIGGNFVEVRGYKVRRMTLGSLLQLQQIGNPYCRLGEIDWMPDDAGNVPTMWAALGITDKQEILRGTAEFLWVHMAAEEEVRDGVFLPVEERQKLVNKIAMGVCVRDFPDLEAVVLGGVVAAQAGMVIPEPSGEDDKDPLGRGRPGAQP